MFLAKAAKFAKAGRSFVFLFLFAARKGLHTVLGTMSVQTADFSRVVILFQDFQHFSRHFSVARDWFFAAYTEYREQFKLRMRSAEYRERLGRLRFFGEEPGRVENGRRIMV